MNANSYLNSSYNETKTLQIEANWLEEISSLCLFYINVHAKLTTIYRN